MMFNYDVIVHFFKQTKKKIYYQNVKVSTRFTYKLIIFEKLILL